MAKIKYDVSNVEDNSGFEHVKPGMYIGDIVEVNEKDSKSGNGAMLEVVLQPKKNADGSKIKLQDKKAQVARVYTYILLEHEPSEWKLKEFVKALALKEKGSLDTDKIVGTTLQMQLKPDTDLDDNYRPRVGKLLALPKDADVSDDDDDDDDEPDTADDASDGDDDEWTREDLEALTNQELKEEAEEWDLEVPKKLTKAGKKKLIDAILESQEESDEDDDSDDDEDDDSDEDGYTWDDLADMDLDGLKEVIEEEELDVKTVTGKGKKKKPRDEDEVRSEVAEALDIEVPEDDDDDEDEDEDDDDADDAGDDEEQDYSSWSVQDLKNEAKERGLKDSGSKKQLIGRLTKDDEDDQPF